jgi:hypothetical protein
MKLTKAQLRKIVRTNLSETPLMDILPFKNKWDYSIDDLDIGPSIGYRMASKLKGPEKERRKQFTDAAKVLLADSEDNWYIIVLKSVGGNPNSMSKVVDSPEFVQWMSSLNIPKGSKILVPAQTRMTGDFLAPEWQIVHDIIGHSIYDHYMNEIQKNSKVKVNADIVNDFDDYFSEHTKITWTSLPDEFKIAKRDVIDRLPDIFAAIFANKFDKQKAVEAYEKLEIFYMPMVEKSIDALYKIVDSFKESVPYDKPTLVYPF